MENMTMNNVAMARFLNETLPALASPAEARSSASWTPVLFILGISLVLIILVYCGLPLIGFVGYGIVPMSYAAAWMASIGNVVAGSLFSLLQMIAMGGISTFWILLCVLAIATLVVGVFEVIVWLAGAVRNPPIWLVDSWDSVTAWVAHAFDFSEMFGWWNSAVAWLHHFWESITLHKWKIYT